jgi:hypothetical protein
MRSIAEDATVKLETRAKIIDILKAERGEEYDEAVSVPPIWNALKLKLAPYEPALYDELAKFVEAVMKDLSERFRQSIALLEWRYGEEDVQYLANLQLLYGSLRTLCQNVFGSSVCL